MNFLDTFINSPKIKLLLDTIFDAIYIVDTTRTIKYWNKGAENITGFKRDEVIGKKCADNILCHIDENGKLLCKAQCPLVLCMQNDEELTEKVYPQHKNKQRFPTITNIAPIKDNDGIVVGAIEVFRDTTTEENYRILQEKFNRLVQKYISNTTYEEIKSQLNNRGTNANTKKEMSILYLDIVDFTSISEKLDPSEVADMLNELFGICDVIIRECQGDIDKFIGDSVMATFIDANDAILSAKKILEASIQFNEQRMRNEQQAIQIRIGINTGLVVQVEVGSHDRKDFTVIGDTVNTASRIESISEPNSIFISESTLMKLSDRNSFELIGLKNLKGKGEKIKVYKYAY